MKPILFNTDTPEEIWKDVKGETMIKRSCEDKNTIYLCLPWARYIFRDGKYIGLCRP